MPQIGHINPGWLILICGLIVLAAGLLLMLQMQRHKSEIADMAVPVRLSSPAQVIPFPAYIRQTTLQPSARIRSNAPASSPPPDQLRIEPPTCYDTPHDTLLCLGRVFNFTDDVVDSVRLEAEIQANGESIIAQPEQRFIMPGSFAPYRAQFSTLPEEDATIRMRLEAADVRRQNSYALAVTDETGAMDHSHDDYGQYVVAATVSNPYQKPMQDVQIVVTLSDSQGQLTGYRVETLPGGIAAGESRALTLEIIPQTLDEVYTHHLTVLAWDE